MYSYWLNVLIVFSIVILIMEQAEGCNEAVCGSVVSKCLLTQSCRCDLKNCTCCKECYGCLGVLFSECCDCVDMCPKQDDGDLSRRSHVEVFGDKVPGLFQVLTEYPDSQNRWNSITYAIDLDPSLFAPKKEVKLHMQSTEQNTQATTTTSTKSTPIAKPILTVLNCTVAFMSQCTSWAKCKNSCQSMGAASYRWFHDGCCECIGDTCINYGIDESRCRQCSLKEELSDDFVFEDELEYDEDEFLPDN